MTRSAGRLAWIRLGPVFTLTLGLVTWTDAEGQQKPPGAPLPSRPGRRAIQLWPPASGAPTTRPAGAAAPIDLGGWLYEVRKSASPRDGVPWEIIATPSARNSAGLSAGAIGDFKVMTEALSAPDSAGRRPDTVPVVRIPDVLWTQRMSAELQQVVGIHYHELVTNDVARILYTIHKVPPDGPDGKPLPGPENAVAGTRIEATLLAPVTYHLDQTIVVRTDPLNKELATRRAEHEMGHAELSQAVFMAALAGPQDWNLPYCKGRRSQLHYYWKRERFGRSWDGYMNGVGKLLTLRTTIVLSPPTRWSMLLPLPPERVTAKHIEAFNEDIVRCGPRFNEMDREAQARFHASHGEFEQAPEIPPRK